MNNAIVMRPVLSPVEIFSLLFFQQQICKIFNNLKILNLIKFMTNKMLWDVAQCNGRNLLTFRINLLPQSSRFMSKVRWKKQFPELKERMCFDEGAKVKIRAGWRGGETGNIYCVKEAKN
jgi:hypothetical protein